MGLNVGGVIVGSNNNRVEENLVSGNGYSNPSENDFGIAVGFGNNNLIEKNAVVRNTVGIRLGGAVVGNVVIENTAVGNRRFKSQTRSPQPLLDRARALISADIFSNILEMAEYLLSEDYKDAAAVLIGGSLEGHLRALATRHGVESHAADKNGVLRPRRAEMLNRDLQKKDAYALGDQKQVTAWLDLSQKRRCSSPSQQVHGRSGEADAAGRGELHRSRPRVALAPHRPLAARRRARHARSASPRA